MEQLNIFGDKPVKATTPTFDKISADLDKLVKMSEAINKHLSKMLSDIQSDWPEDEKMPINNPREYYKKANNQNQTTEKMGRSLSQGALDALKNCTIEGNVVKLGSGQLDRNIYTEVKSALDGIGGAWKGGKVYGFVFPHDPTELLADLQGGTKRNLKKEFQFFGTPSHLCDTLVSMAEIDDGMLVLEPEAGHGAIIEAVYRAFPRCMEGPNDKPCVTIDYYELMPQNAEVISKKLSADKNWGSRTSCMGLDFLTADHTIFYDRVIANPPFNNNQDIDHIYLMDKVLKPKGILVSMASRHWLNSTNKKETTFRQWLNATGAEITDIDAGEFKESGTNIATCIIKIRKP